MPNNFDFSQLQNVQTIEVNPNGWVSPVYIEYGTMQDIKMFGTLSYYWRVKGTQHTFVIPVIRMDFLSSGNYKQHFENVLETFKEDYLIWQNEGFNTQWSKEYRDQYSRFIVV